MKLPEPLRALVESAALGHVVTLEADGTPQVTCVWLGVDGDDVVFASMGAWRKIDNLRRDPRVAVSIESPDIDERGLRHYAVLHGTAAVVEGGAAAVLQRLAHTYLGPEVRFPPTDDPAAGYIVRIFVDRVTGVGPWAAAGG